MPDGPPANRTATVAAIVAILVVIVVAGALFKLGPFSEDSNPGSEVSGDFLASADRICSEAHANFGSQQQGQPKTATEAAQLTKNLLEVAQTELSQIRELTPPPSLKKKVAAYLGERAKGVTLLKKGVGAAEDDDFGAYEAFQAQLAAGQRQRQRLAQAVGLKECSQPSLDDAELAQQARSPGSTSLGRPNQVNNPPSTAP